MAVAALFFSVTGVATGVGLAKAFPLVKRALLANTAKNAKKLQGKTAAQIVASVPAPSSSVSLKTTAWSLGSGLATDVTVSCDAGQKAIGGGAEQATQMSGVMWYLDSRPSPDLASWKIVIWNISAGAKNGTAYAICIK